MTNRIRRLEEEGVISGYRVALNPAKLGWSMTIMAGLRIQKGRMIDVQQNRGGPTCLRRLRRDRRLGFNRAGQVQHRADLDNLTKTVFTLDGVSRSYTHVVLNTVKEDALPSPSVKTEFVVVHVHQRTQGVR